ncbi:MAG: hypothetical protein MK212_20340 [Saprospiraceae bacterium]|nr:hypothetical protein [Saprospiraceae bacterium]
MQITKILGIIVVYWLSVACSPRLSSKIILFQEIKKAAEASNIKRLKKMIVSYDVAKPKMNLQDAMITGIQENYENDNFAYSVEALDVLINDYVEEFEPIGEEMFKESYKKFNFGSIEKLKDLKREDVYVMKKDLAKVIVFKQNNQFKLFFWENLTDLAKK